MPASAGTAAREAPLGAAQLRRAGDRAKFTLDVDKMTDLLQEADYWAGQAGVAQVDAVHVEDSLEPADFEALFADVGPGDLAEKGKVFPIGPFFDDILESYEKQVQN